MKFKNSIGQAMRSAINDETKSHGRAASRHQPPLADMREKPGNHECVNDTADAKARDYNASN